MIKMIEDIYTARFTEDTAYFKSSISMEMDEEHNIDFPGSSFPLFVYSYINTKFRHKKLIDQVIIYIYIYIYILIELR